ncbi:MAG: beta-lactamase family protein [Bacteroidales bacterium]|nr:beta-lactamase family protein [Bacteroidales bacterium]
MDAYLRSLILVLFTGSIILSGCKKNDPGPGFDSLDEELEYLTDKYVKMGAAIGIIKNQQEEELFYGSLSNNNSSPPDEHSVFEIGSITKSFTATLLAQMILDGKISLQDEVEPFLPYGEVSIPVWEETNITIKHLATHSSGLPRAPQESSQPLPSGYDPYDPYAAYTAGDVYDYLTYHCNLLYEPGTQYSYSNTAFGLIGHLLGLIESSSYEELITTEVFEPLGLYKTSLFLTEEQIANLAPGHDESLDSVKNYNAQDIFQGAGFIKSSLHDMMIYLKAQMGLMDTSLEDAMLMTQQSHFEVGGVIYSDREGYYNLSLGLAWHIDLLPEGYTFHWHGGRTNGYMAYMAFDLESQTGVVILCNQSTPNVIIRFGEDVLKAINKY